MKQITKTKTVEYAVYQTLDGKEFDNPISAQQHEDKLSGKTKTCSECGGKGQVNFRTEQVWHNTSWIPTEGKFADVTKSDKCETCGGKGFLELKWI